MPHLDTCILLFFHDLPHRTLISNKLYVEFQNLANAFISGKIEYQLKKKIQGGKELTNSSSGQQAVAQLHVPQCRDAAGSISYLISRPPTNRESVHRRKNTFQVNKGRKHELALSVNMTWFDMWKSTSFFSEWIQQAHEVQTCWSEKEQNKDGPALKPTTQPDSSKAVQYQTVQSSRIPSQSLHQ